MRRGDSLRLLSLQLFESVLGSGDHGPCGDFFGECHFLLLSCGITLAFILHISSRMDLPHVPPFNKTEKKIIVSVGMRMGNRLSRHWRYARLVHNHPAFFRKLAHIFAALHLIGCADFSSDEAIDDEKSAANSCNKSDTQCKLVRIDQSIPVWLKKINLKTKTRTQWGALPSKECAKISSPSKFSITIHHTVINESPANVQKFHLEKKWCDVAYQFLIDSQGVVYPGRSVGVTGAHVKGHNFYGGTQNIGIAMIGCFDKGNPECKSQQSVPTPAAKKSLGQLTSLLSAVFSVETKDINGHNHFKTVRPIYKENDTACPGNQVSSLLPDIRNQVRVFGLDIKTAFGEDFSEIAVVPDEHTGSSEEENPPNPEEMLGSSGVIS